ncbi:MAG: nucleotidyltransferase domain-containing protein [Chloroflexia bacterium]
MVLEGHYLETVEGLFFAVKGGVHPPERYFACLRYVPSGGGGDRRKGDAGYRRLYDWSEQERFLERACPHYLADDPVLHRTVQSVPRECVRQVYDPRVRLEELWAAGGGDVVESDALAFAVLLGEEAGVDRHALGVSGSLLIGLHTPQSDLDLLVYGSRDSWAVHSALRNLRSRGGAVEELDARELAALYVARGASAFCSPEAYAVREKGKAMQGLFRGRPYFIRFLKGAAEMEERYGDRLYTPLGQARIEGTVSDAHESIFTPCCYRVERVRILEGRRVKPLTEIVSYRGRFCEQAQEGDRVHALGTLERVEAATGDVWYRLLLGNSGADFLLPEDGK